MSRNTIPLGRWFAIAADTRLVGRWQVLGLALLCMVLLYPDSAVGRETRPAQRLDGGGPEHGFKHKFLRQRHQRRGRRRGMTSTHPREQLPVLWEVVGTTVTEHVLADGTCATGVNELQQVVGESGGDAAYWESFSSPAVILPPVASARVRSACGAERPGSHCGPFPQRSRTWMFPWYGGS